MSVSSDVSKKIHTRELVLLCVLGLFSISFFAGYSQGRAPILSSETHFTDPSASGLAIVPASCPSNPHYTGQCSTQCTAEYFCSGTNRYYRASSCAESFVETCQYGCYLGQCLPAEGMQFTPFTGIRQGGASFSASGHLQVVPALVRRGDSTRVYWNITNAASCTVTGTNGDTWTVAGTGSNTCNGSGAGQTCSTVIGTSGSGDNGRITSAINERVVYSLVCTGPGAPSTISETEVVNLIPDFVDN